MYRFDYPGLAATLPGRVGRNRVAVAPQLEQPLQILAAAWPAAESPTRLQQLCGAVTAKSVEDCLFYRDARLVSLNEVGGEPTRFGVGAAEFHASAATRARLWPHTMTTLTTHDTKRGEDVRARIGVLSQVPSLWAEFVARWEDDVPPPPTGPPDCFCGRTSSGSGRPTARSPTNYGIGCMAMPRSRSGKRHCTPPGTTRH